MIQQSLLDWTPPESFEARGRTFKADRDSKRLGKQMMAVYQAMSDRQWHTLSELHDLTGYPEASISARIRDLRNQYGFTVQTEFVARGLHRYRVVA